jgi:hypothetical protein
LSIAALSPITPKQLKRVLELYGYTVFAESKANWMLSKDDGDEPIPLPKVGNLVALEVHMEAVFTRAGMDLRKYLALKAKALAEDEVQVN